MCCEWTGVLLSTLLDEVGIRPEAQWVLAEGADAAAMTRSIPMRRCSMMPSSSMGRTASAYGPSKDIRCAFCAGL